MKERLVVGVAKPVEVEFVHVPAASGFADEVDFESNAEFYGTLYAPYAIVEINSNFRLFGALVARSIHLDSNSRIHYDEALSGTGGTSGSGAFSTLCWLVLPNN